MKISNLKYSLIFVLTLAILLVPSSGYAQKAHWKKVELEFCTFLAPSDLSFVSNYLKDSENWVFESDNFKLYINRGVYSGKPDRSIDGVLFYTEKRVRVDKTKATIVRFKFSEPQPDGLDYLTGIYFSKVGGTKAKAFFQAYAKSFEHQKLAEELFLSINFK